MLKIRLRRMGSRHRPFYRVVVSDSRNTPRASATDEIGYYDPRQNPVVLNIDVERAEHWLHRGAQPSETVARLLARVKSGERHALPQPVSPKKRAAAPAETAAPAPAAQPAAEEPVAPVETAATVAAEEPAVEEPAAAEPAAAGESADDSAGEAAQV